MVPFHDDVVVHHLGVAHHIGSFQDWPTGDSFSRHPLNDICGFHGCDADVNCLAHGNRKFWIFADGTDLVEVWVGEQIVSTEYAPHALYLLVGGHVVDDSAVDRFDQLVIVRGSPRRNGGIFLGEV